MPETKITIGGRQFEVACQEGEGLDTHPVTSVAGGP